MAGVADTIARIRGLVDGSITPTGRALTAPYPIDETDRCRGKPDEVPEEIGPAFVLEYLKDEEDPGTLISPGNVSEYARMRLTLSQQFGGGEDAGQDYGQVQSALATLYWNVRSLLENPNNMNRGDTGWIDADNWKSDDPKQHNGRLHKQVHFRCLVEQILGAL